MVKIVSHTRHTRRCTIYLVFTGHDLLFFVWRDGYKRVSWLEGDEQVRNSKFVNSKCRLHRPLSNQPIIVSDRAQIDFRCYRGYHITRLIEADVACFVLVVMFAVPAGGVWGSEKGPKSYGGPLVHRILRWTKWSTDAHTQATCSGANYSKSNRICWGTLDITSLYD